jgi:hypothetical protein
MINSAGRVEPDRSHIAEHTDPDSPLPVEGLPGVGLVGKVTTSHLVEEFDTVEYTACHWDGLARTAAYEKADRSVRPPGESTPTKHTTCSHSRVTCPSPRRRARSSPPALPAG